MVDAGFPTGLLSEGHPLFERLLLWDDSNHNGLSEAGEVEKFSDHYVGFAMGYEDDGLLDSHGNQFRFRGNATIRVGKSKKYPVAPTVCDAYKCWTDRSEELSRIIDVFDVSFVTR
jgi:hypothetical protein